MTSKDLPQYLYDDAGNKFQVLARSGDDPDMWVRVYPVTPVPIINTRITNGRKANNKIIL